MGGWVGGWVDGFEIECVRGGALRGVTVGRGGYSRERVRWYNGSEGVGVAPAPESVTITTK